MVHASATARIVTSSGHRAMDSVIVYSRYTATVIVIDNAASWLSLYTPVIPPFKTLFDSPYEYLVLQGPRARRSRIIAISKHVFEIRSVFLHTYKNVWFIREF